MVVYLFIYSERIARDPDISKISTSQSGTWHGTL